MIDQGMKADDRGRPPEARAHYLAGLRDCLHSVNYLHTLLDGLPSEGPPDRDESRVLARYPSVAVLGAAACHVGLDSDGEGVGGVGRQLPLLRRAARRVFAATAGRDPARFLSLPVGGGEVSLPVMADLFQRARLAGVVDAPGEYTPAGWFEEHRATIAPFARRPPYTRRAG